MRLGNEREETAGGMLRKQVAGLLLASYASTGGGV